MGRGDPGGGRDYFNKSVILLVLVGHGLIIANSARYAPHWLSIILYPMHVRRVIIVKYFQKKF